MTIDKPSALPCYLSPKDLAKRYQVTQQQITKLARNGILPAVKVGKLWRFKSEAVEEWERSQYDVTRIADQIVGTTKSTVVSRT